MAQRPSEHRREVILDSVEIEPGLGTSCFVQMRLVHRDSREESDLYLSIEWDRPSLIEFRRKINHRIGEQVLNLEKQLFDENKRRKE